MEPGLPENLSLTLAKEVAELRELAEPLLPFMSEEDQHWLEAALQQLMEQQLCIAIMGEIKVGKSTLINALLGRPVLVSDVVECTAAPTYIRHASVAPGLAPDSVRVTWADQHVDDEALERLADVTTLMAGDPHRRIERVELFVSGELPPPTLTIVDTPGLNGRPDLAERTLRQMALAHVAVIVLAPERGLGTADDVATIRRAQRVAGRLLVVINKGDLASNEGELFRQIRGLTDVLYAAGVTLEPERIFALSAKQELTEYPSEQAYLKREFVRFLDALVNGLEEDWRVSMLRRQPRSMIAGMAARIADDLRTKLADAERLTTADIDAELAAIERCEQELEWALASQIARAHADAQQEVESIRGLLGRQTIVLTRAMREQIRTFDDALLDDGPRAIQHLWDWLRHELEVRVHGRIQAIFGALAERLFRDLTAQAGSGLKLRMPQVTPERLQMATLEVGTHHQRQDLQAAADELASLDREIYRLEQQIIQQERVQRGLRGELEEIAVIEGKKEAALQQCEDLGPRPALEYKTKVVECYTEVSRSGVLGWIRDLFGKEKVRTTTEIPTTDDSKRRAWDEAYRLREQKVAELSEELKARNRNLVCKKLRDLEADLQRDGKNLAKALRRRSASQEELETLERQMREEESGARRRTLLEHGARTLERAMDALGETLEPDFDQLIQTVELEFRGHFAAQAEHYRTTLNSAARQRKATIEGEQHTYQVGLAAAEAVVARLS